MKKQKIIVIEDNPDISTLVKLHLEDIGLEVELSEDGLQGWELMQRNHYDLAILDIMLPGMDGLEILKGLRALPNNIPVLMLTSRSSELDRVLGLELGADDYLTKPFSLMELVARVKAMLRRQQALSEQQDAMEMISFSHLSIDPKTREVVRENKKLELTAREFDLLYYFARHPGQVFGRMQLLDKVWGYGHEGYEHTVNSHINRLRGKLETDPASPQMIKTVWGVGYQFNPS